MSSKKILHVGLGDAPPGFKLTDEEIRQKVQDGADQAKQKGFDVELTYIMSPDIQSKPSEVLDIVREKLTRLQPAATVFGGGVRMDPRFTVFLEELVNLSRETSPQSRIGFQQKPDDIAEVCERLFKSE